MYRQMKTRWSAPLQRVVAFGVAVLAVTLIAQPASAQCMSGGGAAAAGGGGGEGGGGAGAGGGANGGGAADTATDVANAVAMMNIAQRMYREQQHIHEKQAAQIEAYLKQRTKQIESKARRDAAHVATAKQEWRERQRDRQEKRLERRIAQFQKDRKVNQGQPVEDPVKQAESGAVVVVLR